MNKKTLILFVLIIYLLFPALALPMGNTPSNELKIASFNIQVFGKAKAAKPKVMDILAPTIAKFDIVAIQEIRDKSGTAIKALEAAVDALGEDYAYIIGPRLGRSRSKEQYAFMYRVRTITPGTSYTYQETGEDALHREPFVAQFTYTATGFDFILITTHVDPDTVAQELKVFPDIVADAKERFPGEKEIMIMGDMNADGSYFDEDKQIQLRDTSKYKWLITNDMDTNVAKGNKSYDRMIATKALAEYFTGEAGVFQFDKEFNLRVAPKKVSDHYPVYAVFNRHYIDFEAC